MAEDPEAHAQLARLLANADLRSADSDALRAAVDKNFDRLVDGIVAEVAASDDVLDQQSALSFVRLRLESLQSVLTEPQTGRILQAVETRIQSW